MGDPAPTYQELARNENADQMKTLSDIYRLLAPERRTYILNYIRSLREAKGNAPAQAPTTIP